MVRSWCSMPSNDAIKFCRVLSGRSVLRHARPRSSPSHTQPLSAAARMTGDVLRLNCLPAGERSTATHGGCPTWHKHVLRRSEAGSVSDKNAHPARHTKDVPWRPSRCMSAAIVKEMDPAQAGLVMLWSASTRYDRPYRSRGQGDDRTCSRTCLRRILPSIERGMSSICTIRRGTL